MGKHKGNPADETQRAQDKADKFDAQFAASRAAAEAKRDAGQYPYDLDNKYGKKN